MDQPSQGASSPLVAGLCVLLCGITWLVFAQTLSHDFVNYDDNTYIYQNADVAMGLTLSGLVSAFTHFQADNWHPLSTISHMLDCQFFGLRAGGHHFTNVLLHTIAVVLLFLVLRQMTGGPSSPRDESVRSADRTGNIWRSAFVAAVFAIHPLHVESVAWISERKDVLSGVFFMLTLGAYVRYARKRTLGRYATMSILFALGLMSKPMLVTTPLVLLLLDYWPLKRIIDLRTLWNVVFEKIPLFVLSVASSIATLFAQRESSVATETLPFLWRFTNAFSACTAYIWQMIWPAKLAVLYPHPGNRISTWQLTSAIALLVAIAICAFAYRKTRPYLVTGYLWYLIMLVPAIGLVQVGVQARADRYTYLPQIGLYILVTWAVADVSLRWRRRREILGAASVTIVASLAWSGWVQTSYWRNGETLWRHALALTSNNDLARLNLGQFLLEHQRVDEAIPCFRMVLAVHPNYLPAISQLATALLDKGQVDEAIACYDRMLGIKSDDPETETILANALLANGRAEEAIAHYRNVLRLHSDSAVAHFNLAVGLHRQGRLTEAIVYYKEVFAMQPDYPELRSNLGNALLQNGQVDEASVYLDNVHASPH